MTGTSSRSPHLQVGVVHSVGSTAISKQLTANQNDSSTSQRNQVRYGKSAKHHRITIPQAPSLAPLLYNPTRSSAAGYT